MTQPKPGRPSRQSKGREALGLREARAISDRLRAWIRKRYVSRAAFSQAVGIPEGTMAGWFTKRPSTPQPNHLLAIARSERLSLDWLLLGEGSQEIGSPASGEFEPFFHDRLIRDIHHAPESKGITIDQIRSLLPSARITYEMVVRDFAEVVKEMSKG